MKLRDYQEANIAEIRAHLASGKRSVLWQLPTGGGKTAGAAYMAGTAASRGRRVWFVCHRRELLRQSSEAFADAGIGHAMIAAGALYDRRRQVHICGIDTLRRRLAVVEPPDLIIWDECHHISAKSWATVFDRYPNCRNIGLSATPERLDGNGLGRFFDAMVVGPSSATLIDEGYLSPYRLFAPANEVDLSGVHIQAGDFNKKELNEVMQKPKVIGDAVSHYLKIASGRPTLLFAPSVKFSEEIAARFRDAGVPAMHVDASTEAGLRYSAIRDLEHGALKVLCNVDLFGEGVSVNNVACVIQMRPTWSLSMHLQQIGRGLRTFPGKSDCIILDHAGNSSRHGLPDDEREWSLDGRERRKKDRDPDDMPVKQCPACYAVNRSIAQKCRECGEAFVVKSRKVTEVEGELAEVDPDEARRQQRVTQAKADSVDKLVAMGYSEGRARHILEARAEKEQLRQDVLNLSHELWRATGESRLSTPVVRALKPKQLRELRDEMQQRVERARRAA